MALLGRAALLLRSFTSWPASYSAIIFSFITHAIASIIKAAFFFYPTPTKRWDMLTFSTQGNQIPKKHGSTCNLFTVKSRQNIKPFERKTEFCTPVAQIGKFPENSACHPHFCRLWQVSRESTADKMHWFFASTRQLHFFLSVKQDHSDHKMGGTNLSFLESNF